MSDNTNDDRPQTDDDVEGHGMNTRRDTEGATRREGEGVAGGNARRADGGDDDVEGHGMSTRRDTEGATRREGEGVAGGNARRADGGDDDVEGHAMRGGLSGSSGRGE